MLTTDQERIVEIKRRLEKHYYLDVENDIPFLLSLATNQNEALRLACVRIADSNQTYEEANSPEGWEDYFMQQALKTRGAK